MQTALEQVRLRGSAFTSFLFRGAICGAWHLLILGYFIMYTKIEVGVSPVFPAHTQWRILFTIYSSLKTLKVNNWLLIVGIINMHFHTFWILFFIFTIYLFVYLHFTMINTKEGSLSVDSCLVEEIHIYSHLKHVHSHLYPDHRISCG